MDKDTNFIKHALVMSISNLPSSSSTKFLQKNRLQKRRHRQPRWQVLAVIALGVMMVSTNLEAEEKFDIDWSNLEGSSLSQRLDLDSRIILPKLLPSSIFTGPETEPPNPFPDSKPSLYVTTETPDNQWFRLAARPFVEQDAPQGALEFKFHLVKGAIQLSLGRCDQPWIPEDGSTYAVTELRVAVSFAPDQEVQIRGRSYQTGLISTLSAGENYRFMVKWDMSTPERFTYFLTGELLRPLTGSSAQNLSDVSADTGINAFRIALGNSEDSKGSFFLGRISARSLPVDLSSPEGLLAKIPATIPQFCFGAHLAERRVCSEARERNQEFYRFRDPLDHHHNQKSKMKIARIEASSHLFEHVSISRRVPATHC